VAELSGPDAPVVRDVRDDDAAALLAIYAPLVAETTISFEVEVPTTEDFRERILGYRKSHAWLVAERDGRILGYAYGSPHRARAAYRFSCETSAYVAPEARRRGIGRLLYEELFDRLAARGYCHAYAGITLPNDASVALHRRVGFAPIGVFPRVGRKFGRWHDVAWYHRPLREGPPSSDGIS
jgi:L-amino acid N-acyltransferase YncA